MLGCMSVSVCQILGKSYRQPALNDWAQSLSWASIWFTYTSWETWSQFVNLENYNDVNDAVTQIRKSIGRVQQYSSIK